VNLFNKLHLNSLIKVFVLLLIQLCWLKASAAPDTRQNGLIQTYDEMPMWSNAKIDEEKQQLVNKFFSQSKKELIAEEAVSLKAKNVKSNNLRNIPYLPAEQQPKKFPPNKKPKKNGQKKIIHFYFFFLFS
jgi:hypothetical protein